MLYDLRIRLTSLFLGNFKAGTARRFVRGDSEDRLELNVKQWHYVLQESAQALHMDPMVDVTMVALPSSFRKPTLQLYRRNYTDARGTPQHAMHEVINTNTVLTFEVFIPNASSDPKRRPPSVKEATDLFSFAGQFIGLSPWGSKFGHGRFTVENLRETDARASLVAIERSRLQLPPEFVDANRPKADDIVILGRALTKLSKTELLAVAAFYHGQIPT